MLIPMRSIRPAILLLCLQPFLGTAISVQPSVAFPGGEMMAVETYSNLAASKWVAQLLPNVLSALVKTYETDLHS